jgi:hypothetical protein
VRAGKQALAPADRPRISVAAGAAFGCSIDLDAAMSQKLPNAHRWDYLVVIREAAERCVGVEVHPATAGEVRRIIAKRDWARQLLEQRCARGRPSAADWHWLASGRVYLRPTDPQFRVLRSSGINGPTRALLLRAS